VQVLIAKTSTTMATSTYSSMSIFNKNPKFF
jgi:hypothetical protein